MIAILKLLIQDVIKFFILFGLLFYVADNATGYVPKSWDPTGFGMLVLIILIILFFIGAFRIGASYSDDLEVQEPGSVINIFKRPIRSVKYGVISLLMNFLLVYLTMFLSDMIIGY